MTSKQRISIGGTKARTGAFWKVLLAGGGLWMAASGLVPMARADCVIEAPFTVEADESFTVCGTRGDDYLYEWTGPGMPTGARARCVTVDGRPSGMYEYTLRVGAEGRQETCSCIVTVQGSGKASTLGHGSAVAPPVRVTAVPGWLTGMLNRREISALGLLTQAGAIE